MASRVDREWPGNVRWPEYAWPVVWPIYALANQKGGVGKTTTAVNLAACLAEAGERVLVVDLDPQANATSGLGERANGTSSYDLLDGAPLERSRRADTVREPRPRPVPAGPGRRRGRARAARGRRALPRRVARRRRPIAIAFVFLDCPPSLGPLTVNALAAADRVLVPVQAEYYALEGLSQLLELGRARPARLNPRLSIAGVLLTMVDGRTRLSADVGARSCERHLGGCVFRTPVPRSVRLAEAPSHGLPVIAYDRALRRRRGVLEGGDGACRAYLSDDAPGPRPRPRGADRRRRRRPELAHLSGRRSSPEPAPAAPASSTTRRRQASPSRSARRASSSRSSSGRVARAARS